MEQNNKAARKKYDLAFKRSSVDLLLSSGKPISQIAGELGVSPWNLRGWKKRFAPAPVMAARTPAQMESQIRELQRELCRVKIQRDILKKTLGILSSPSDNDLNA